LPRRRHKIAAITGGPVQAAGFAKFQQLLNSYIYNELRQSIEQLPLSTRFFFQDLRQCPITAARRFCALIADLRFFAMEWLLGLEASGLA
jgi:hypothetical protein